MCGYGTERMRKHITYTSFLPSPIFSTRSYRCILLIIKVINNSYIKLLAVIALRGVDHVENAATARLPPSHLSGLWKAYRQAARGRRGKKEKVPFNLLCSHGHLVCFLFYSRFKTSSAITSSPSTLRWTKDSRMQYR